MQVVSPNKWLPLAATSLLLAVGLSWGIFGRIPIAATGEGILVYSSKVVSFQSPIVGKLQTINVDVGDFVKKGEVLATIDQSELTKQLQLTRGKLAQLQAKERDASLLQLQRQDLDEQAIQQQRQALQQSLVAVQKLTPILKEKGLDSIQLDRASLQQRLQAIRELLPTFEQRLNNRQQLLQQGAVSSDTVLQARQDYLNAVIQMNEAESQLKQLDVKEAVAQREYLDNLNSIKDLQTQLKQLNSKQAAAAQQDLEATTNREKEIQEVERSIAQMELQLKNNSQLESDYSGRILEISATPGQAIQLGTPISAIAAQEVSDRLVSVAFFQLAMARKFNRG